MFSRSWRYKTKRMCPLTAGCHAWEQQGPLTTAHLTTTAACCATPHRTAAVCSIAANLPARGCPSAPRAPFPWSLLHQQAPAMGVATGATFRPSARACTAPHLAARCTTTRSPARHGATGWHQLLLCFGVHDKRRPEIMLFAIGARRASPEQSFVPTCVVPTDFRSGSSAIVVDGVLPVAQEAELRPASI